MLTIELLKELHQRWENNEPEDVLIIWQFIDAIIEELIEYKEKGS